MRLGLGLGLARSTGGGGGPPPPTVTLASPFMYDDFAATNTSLTGRSGWNVLGDAGKAALIKADGGVARMNTDFNGQSPYGFQMTAALPTQDRKVIFSIDTSEGFAGSGAADDAANPKQWLDQRIYLSYIDESNHIVVNIGGGSFGDPDYRLDISHVVAGSIVKTWQSDRIPLAGTYEAQIIDNNLRIWLNGQIFMSDKLTNNADNKFPDTVINAPAVSSRAGFRHGFYGWNICSGPFTVDVIRTTANIGSRFYGRDAAQGRTVTVSGKYTVVSAQPTQWAYRVLNEETGAVVTNWTTWTPTAAAGTYTGTIRLNQGGAYIVEIAWTDGVNNWFSGKSLGVAVGLLFVGWGQSNASGSGDTLTTTYSVRGNTGARNYKIYGWRPAINSVPARFIGDSWRQEDPNSFTLNMATLEFCRVVAAATGLPVGYGATGVAGNAISTLKPGTSNWTTILTPFVSALGGNVEGFIWTQGEAEALAASPYATYAADFALVVAGFRSDFANRSDAPVFLRMIGDDDSLTNTAPEVTKAFESRKVFVGLENPANNIWIGGYPLGLTKADTVHYVGDGHRDWSRRVSYTVARRMGIGTPLTYDGRGPRPTSASRSAAVITIALDMNGYSSLAGTALTGYEVSNDDFATTLTISSAVVSGSTIVITLSATPTGTVKVRSFVQANYNDSSLATAALADGFRIPVEPIINPITVT